MLHKTVPLLAMLFLCFILGTAEAAGTSGTIRTASTKSDPAHPCKLSVVFANGLNSTTYSLLSNFTVYINITNCPGIGFFDIGIHWDPSVLELKDNNTATDVVEGTFMSHFSTTAWGGESAAGTDLAAGNMSDISCGFMSAGINATGSGTLFSVLFHAKTTSSSTIISIDTPNVISYLLDPTLNNLVTINAIVNGSVVVVVPEFPASALLPVFLVVTAISVTAASVASRKRRVLPKISQHE